MDVRFDAVGLGGSQTTATRYANAAAMNLVKTAGSAGKIRPFPTSDNVSYVRLDLSNYREFLKFVGKHCPTMRHAKPAQRGLEAPLVIPVQVGTLALIVRHKCR